MAKDDGDQANGDADSQDNGDSDSDDSDDVKVTIGEIKSGPQAYGSLNIKVCILKITVIKILQLRPTTHRWTI